MISGSQALGSIDGALNQAHAQIAALQAEIAQTTETLLKTNQEQAGDYRNLARARLDRLPSGELVQTLDHAEQQVVALLAQREQALAALLRTIADAEALRVQREGQRQRQAAQLNRAVAVVDEAEARTQLKLDADADYRLQRERVEQAERKALHAAEKASRSAEELEQKGAAYRGDPLFTYLWERRYGQPEYRGRRLFRWLDGKVARLIGYADARANFARLNEIPLRLREHATHLKSLADAEFTRLRELDELARAADGIPNLEERVAEEQRRLDEIDAQIAGDERHYQSLLAEQARFGAGEDPHMQEAVEYLANEFRRDDLVQLRYDAIRTPYPEDDVIVARMLQREDDQRRLQSSIDGLKEALKQQQDRLLELESLRADFKRNHYDRAGSVFANDAMIPVLLGQFLAGMLDRRNLWKVLQEQQRYAPHRSDPDFGSGGFGRGTVWKGGLGDLGDIIGGLGRGGFGGRRGGGGGGGFRTGGGF
jgi:hypothetical protein